MSNFDTARDALETSLNSEGSALEEHEKYTESIEYKLNSLKASWQSFAQTFMESDTLKGGISALTGLVDILEKLIDNFGLLGTIGFGVAGKGLWSYFKGAKEAKATLNDVVHAIRETSNATKEASAVSVNSDNAEAIASEQAANAEMQEVNANQASAQAEITETTANTTSATSEMAENTANIASTESELAEIAANGASTASEVAETTANEAATISELAEATANKASAASETEEATSSTISAQAELEESAANVTSTTTEAAEATANLNSATTEVAESAASAAGGFKKFATSMSGISVIAGIAIGVISSLVQAYKNYREEISQARQEAIKSADAFLDSASSFEQAYIKYSGKTDLTVEEEAELEAAIKGTVDALNDKSSALQGVVNSSNDYVAALEKITDAELEEAARAAKVKRDNAEIELKDTTKGWTSIDGSEIDVVFKHQTSKDNLDETDETIKIAKEVGGDFFKKHEYYVGKLKRWDYELEISANASVSEIIEYYHMLEEYRDRLSDEGFIDTDAWRNANEIIKEMEANIKAYEDGQYEVLKTQYQLDNGIPTTIEQYWKMRNHLFNDASVKNRSFEQKLAIANSLDSDLGQAFDTSSIEFRARKFAGVIEGFGDGSIDGSNEVGTVETFLNIQTALNDEECTVGEYLSEFNNMTSMAENFSDEEREAFNLEFGLDTDKVKEQYDDMYDYLMNNTSTNIVEPSGNPMIDAKNFYNITSKKGKEIKEFLDGLTTDELAAVVDIRTEIDWDNTSAEDIRRLIEDQVKLNEALSFSASIEVDKTALESLNTALEESASAMGLSEESIDSLKSKYKDLEGYNPHTLFERTANGVKVNREELAKLEKEYNDLTKTEVQEYLDTLVDAYNDVTAEIDECTNAGERAELLAKRETYTDQIEELAEYQSQLEGVTGAYQKWLDAQNGSEDYEGYESVATSKEDIQDEIDRGFISNKGKAYIDLLSGENLEGKSIDDYYNAWEKLDEKVGSTSYSIHDFFTVNDDGDITSEGVDRFFKGLQQDFKGSVAKFNDETGKWEYDFSQENLQKIQDEWGIGIEAIELLLESAAAAGYDVDWGGIFDDLDLDTSNFESLVSVAEKAQKELNKLEGYEDLDFNFSTTTIEAATSELDKAQKVYNELVTNDDGTINIDAEGADNVRVILATLLVQKQQLEDSEIAINISTSGLDDSQAKAVAWVQDFRTKYKNLEIAISTGEGIEEAKTELETVKTSLGELDGDTAKIAAQLVLGEDTDTNGEGFKTQVTNAIDSIGKQDINVGFKLDGTSISDLNSNLLSNFTVNATAKITGVDKSQLESVETGGMVNWNENTDGVSKSFEADGTVNWDDNVKNVKTSFSASGTVKWTSGNNVKVKVISEANGTANANGSANSGRAFARGNWGIKGNGIALGGELGRELVVRDGKFFTIGDKGAEFFHYKPNDIVFNAAQTESLLKYGGIKGAKPRGKMFAEGSAFAEGKAFAWNASTSTSNFANKRWGISSLIPDSKKKEFKKNAKTETKTSTKDDSVTTTTTTTWNANASDSNFTQDRNDKSPISDSDKEKDKFEETIDFVEIAISRIEREIDNLDQKVNNVYTSWSSRNKALTDEISKVGEEITKQNQGYDRYIQEADSVGLSDTWVERVKNGTIDIYDENDFDEDTAKKIKEYREWYEKALGCKDAIEELKERESELYAQRFENIQTQYDGILQGYEHTESMLNEYINQAEEQGHLVSTKYYEALINNEKSNIETLRQEQAALIAERDEIVAEGKILKYSEAWYDMCAEIDNVTQSIEEGTSALIEYNNAIREIDWQKFDLIQERISDITAESEFLIELMSNKDLFDDDGKLTKQGAATMGLHAQNYNVAMYQSDDYGKEIAKLDKQIAKDPYDQELINRRREIIELQREQILAAEDCKNSIKSLLEEGYEKELDCLQEKIDKTNEAIDSQKD